MSFVNQHYGIKNSNSVTKRLKILFDYSLL